MNKKDFITPAIFGLITLILVLIFKENLILITQNKNFSSEIFTFSSLLFGLILTSYAMLFGVIPALNKEFREWDILKDINLYFISCLFFLLISVILSLIYMFYQSYLIFSINFISLGIDIGFFGYIIFLVKDIFNFVSHEGN